MKKSMSVPAAKTAILTLVEIKAAIEAFERGDSNAFTALDDIAFAVEAYLAATRQSREAA